MKSRWKPVCAGFDSCNRITAACLNTLALRQLSHLVSAILESPTNCPYSREKELHNFFSFFPWQKPDLSLVQLKWQTGDAAHQRGSVLAATLCTYEAVEKSQPQLPPHLFKYPLSVLSPRHSLHAASRSAPTLPWSRKGLEETSVRARSEAWPGCPNDPQGPAGILLQKWECSDLSVCHLFSCSAFPLPFLFSALEFYFSWAAWQSQTKLLCQKDITARKVEFCLSGTALVLSVQEHCTILMLQILSGGCKHSKRSMTFFYLNVLIENTTP